ncbi:helix-turn-helix domain-containing protein [Pandoraea sp. CB10b_02]|uniref:methylation-associated defense system helix-turn-helix domain-containing protein MAD1 n=1 Tax=Pandoraea sp. CB10b_02 TaxID=2014535 RepID=UPI00257F1D42|nr:helix-turn-helix domain-containing protein [Pandoraea sp. CB10b_02]
MKEDAGEIFTLDEVAAYLKVGKRTVYRLAAAKKIPAFKVGGTWRFRRQEIDQWITEQTEKGWQGREDYHASPAPVSSEQKKTV